VAIFDSGSKALIFKLTHPVQSDSEALQQHSAPEES